MVIDQELTLSPSEYGLLTDLYQLTMITCYVGEGIEDHRASFELFVRHLPPNFGYLIAMGLTQVIEYLEKIQFSQDHLTQLEATGIFKQAPAKFWSLLQSAKFTGDVWALPEGTSVFPHEPILRIEAPLWQAQLVETYLLNTINYQTLIATKAARMRDAAGEKAIMLEFGTRRAFSPQASLWAARAALGGGLDATSNVLAALKLGEKPAGTMAHSLIMAIKAIAGNEDDAFTAFSRYFPEAALLIDTYDTIAAAKNLAAKVQEGKMNVTGVRIDSGDIAILSQKVRSLLPEIQIFASGDIDEYSIKSLQEQGATLDGYGIGTKLVTGSPVNGVYKLVEIDGIPTMKKSEGKATYPGRKQIFRKVHNQTILSDRLGLASESPQVQEQPLLQLMMQEGKKTVPVETISTIRQRSLASVAALPVYNRKLWHPESISVNISDALASLANEPLQ